MPAGFQAIIFDMDGVLVDAADSYRAVIVATVRGFVVDQLGLAPPPVDKSWPEALKRAGGFNNDWDLSSALVRGVAALGERFEIAAYEAALTDAGGGLQAVDAVLGTEAGHLGPGGAIHDLFQHYYLGPPRFIDRETLIIDPKVVRGLDCPVGIATGRPREEATYALDRFQIASAFGALVTHDDVVEAGARGKPDPWCVLEAMRRLGLSGGRTAYVGDTPDDMRAAIAAGCVPIGISGGNADAAAALEYAGAHEVWQHPDQVQGRLA